jgi:hypothetical protein
LKSAVVAFLLDVQVLDAVGQRQRLFLRAVPGLLDLEAGEPLLADALLAGNARDRLVQCAVLDLLHLDDQLLPEVDLGLGAVGTDH